MNGHKPSTVLALRESERRYRMLMEQASDGIHTYDFQGNFIEVNTRLCEMLGYTREQLLRLNVKDLIPTEELVSSPIRFNELSSGKTIIRERQLLRQDGGLLPVEITSRMLQEGVLLGIVRNLTARKQAEERLRQSEEWLRAILVVSRDGILVEENETIVRERVTLLGGTLSIESSPGIGTAVFVRIPISETESSQTHHA